MRETPFVTVGDFAEGYMLSILLNWLYIAIIVLVIGDAVLRLYDFCCYKIAGYNRDYFKQNIIAAAYCGIMATTVYGQIMSFFMPLDFMANLILIGIVCIYLFFHKNYFIRLKRNLSEAVRTEKFSAKVHWIIIIAVILIFAASSAGPAKLIDTDWYHAQTIRWIEEYGCVKGVANLFYALGFNNVQHYFDALFSMHSFLGQSLRGTGGFFGFLIFLHAYLRLIHFKEHKSHIADAIALGEIAYSIIITAFYADPYVDTLPNGIVLFIMAEWFALLETNEKQKTFYDEQGKPLNENIKAYAFYCILAVFAVVAKTSVAAIILITVCPAYILLKNKRWKEILTYIAMGLIILIPFFISNIITTGYPVYLFTAIDICNVPWKVDPSVLEYSIDNMIAFARMPLLPMEEALSMGWKWIPDWFRRESVSHQILYIVILLFIVYDLIQIIKSVWKKKMENLFSLWPRICIYISLIYWFNTIPQVKYCWSFLILAVALIPTIYMGKSDFKKNKILKALMVLQFSLFVLYTGFYSLRTAGYVWKGVKHNFLMQEDYENHVFNEIEKNGHTFYTRIENGDIVCGYYIFPYLDNKDDLERLHVGSSLAEGFYFEE